MNSSNLVDSVKEKAEAIHGHNSLGFVVSAMKCARKRHVPFVYEGHDLTANSPIMKKKTYIPKIVHSLGQELLKLRENRIFQSADALVKQTNGMMQRITNTYLVDTRRIKIIPNGVDERKFDPVV